jgi:hypothetical protein
MKIAGSTMGASVEFAIRNYDVKWVNNWLEEKTNIEKRNKLQQTGTPIMAEFTN